MTLDNSFLNWLRNTLRRLIQPLQSLSLSLQANMGVMFQHFPADVSSNAHDGLITQSHLSKFCNGMVPQIMEAEA